MYKCLTGLAAAAMLTFATAPGPAQAAPIKNVAGLAEAQTSVEHVQHRRYRQQRHWRGHRYHYAPRRAYRYYGAPAYVYQPYPYQRRYYRPGPYVQFGPFGFGAW
jgi:hypothetical protein